MLSRSCTRSAVLFAAVSAPACFAQSYTDWGLVASNSDPGLYGDATYAVDLNNDGVTDLVTNEVYSGNVEPYFAVFIANGDGTFQAPVQYQYSPSSIPPGDTGPYNIPMTFGDFNGDGNIDIAMPVGNHTIAVYLGKGDGTFVNPWYSVINLPSNQYILTSFPVIVAADFNHDGKLDLAVVGVNSDESGETVYVLPGQGNGLFSDAIPVLNVAADPSASGGVRALLTGDFDGDANADLVAEVSAGSSNGESSGATAVHVLYGDENFGFDDTIPITEASAIPPLNTGDLNSDGKSDLYSIGFEGHMLTWYGQGGRTFASYDQPIPPAEYIPSSQPMADFNNDGLNDLVATAITESNSFLVFLLATPTPGQFDVQTWNTPTPMWASVGASGFYSTPVVGTFRRDEQKPDIAYIAYTGPETYAIDTSVPYVGLNATVGQLWSNCDYPSSGNGISLCSPALMSGNQVNFNATAHSFGDLRKMEVWVDGTKLGEQYNTWESSAFLSLSATFAPGTHSGTYFAADWDNTLLRYDFNFTVPSDCAAPTSPGVNICAPTDGSSISSQSVLVQATSNITGTLARMEIWIDTVKEYTETHRHRSLPRSRQAQEHTRLPSSRSIWMAPSGARPPA